MHFDRRRIRPPAYSPGYISHIQWVTVDPYRKLTVPKSSSARLDNDMPTAQRRSGPSNAFTTVFKEPDSNTKQQTFNLIEILSPSKQLLIK
jgi:hypothetical protein